MFLVFSEPGYRSWCHRKLAKGNHDVVVISDRAAAEEDLQLLASLKHFVYSHGTFGLWGILLSDAKVVVYPDKSVDGTKRYSHHFNFDKLSRNLTDVTFVTVPQ